MRTRRLRPSRWKPAAGLAALGRRVVLGLVLCLVLDLVSDMLGLVAGQGRGTWSELRLSGKPSPLPNPHRNSSPGDAE